MPLQAWNVGVAEYTRQAQQGILTNSLTATGNSLATGLALPTDFDVFTTVASGTGCVLLGSQAAGTGPCLPSDSIIVTNHGANTLLVYPFAATGKIANGSAGAGFSVSATKTGTFTLISGGPDVWAASVSA